MTKKKELIDIKITSESMKRLLSIQLFNEKLYNDKKSIREIIEELILKENQTLYDKFIKQKEDL